MGGVYEGHQRRVMTAALELIFGAQIQEQDCQKMENLSKTQIEVLPPRLRELSPPPLAGSA